MGKDSSSLSRARQHGVIRLLAFVIAALLPPAVFSIDPPHSTNSVDVCTSCHLAHQTLGTPLLNVAGGNANLCQSCHIPGGPVFHGEMESSR
jgi:predicted CXXCH cytochrome family protein